MNEKTIEKGLIKAFRDDNIFVRKMTVSSAPGYPDIEATMNSKNILIEVKYTKAKNPSIRPLFKMSQIPFYIDYVITHNNENIYCVINKKIYQIDHEFIKLLKFNVHLKNILFDFQFGYYKEAIMFFRERMK
jgi:hypothetical protein